MKRLRGRCPKGRRLNGKAPFGHWKTQTFIAGVRRRGLTAPFVVDQPMNRRIFEVWVETQLVPTLSRGDVVRRINAMHSVYRFKPDSSGLNPAMTVTR